MVKNINYDKWIGAQKSLKNIAKTWLAPALLLLLNNWADWVPAEYALVGSPLIGFLSYFVLNWMKHK